MWKLETGIVKTLYASYLVPPHSKIKPRVLNIQQSFTQSSVNI